MKLKILLCLNLIGSISCVFNLISEKVASTLKTTSESSTGMLDNNQFNYTILTPSNSSKNPLPLQIKIGGYCFGKNLDIIISQVEGNSSLVKSQVWQRTQSQAGISAPPTANTIYQGYADASKTVYATVMPNTDLHSFGFDTNGLNFRMTITMTISGIQVDIQAALVIDTTYGTQVNFEHIYFARANLGGDYYGSALNRTTPCSSSPCQNGGLCSLINSTAFNCFCTAGWGGDSGLCDEEQELSKCKHCAKQGTGLHFTTTTTPKPSLCWQQGKNPCNLGTCTISSTAKHGYLCFCPPDVQGEKCEIKTSSYNSQNTFGSSYLGKGSLDNNIIKLLKSRINDDQHSRRAKRAVTGVAKFNLYVEYLAVVDLGVYNYFVSLYGSNLPQSQINDYINIFFTQLINGMNQRFQGSLVNDPDLFLTISLTNVLIITEPKNTQWTNATFCAVAGYPTYNGKTPIVTSCSLGAFTNYMNSISSSLPFDYDHAVGVLAPSLDAWDSSTQSAGTRSGVIGMCHIGQICGTKRYSIVEFLGLNSIGNNAHELGHNLGSNHDGDKDKNGDSSSCPVESNYIMTVGIGFYTNASNSFYFSNCSINLFKKTILNPGYKSVNKTCLINSPVSPFAIVSATYQYPGQFYNMTLQCRLAMGSSATNTGCNSGAGMDTLCQSLGCQTPGSSCFYSGIGALDGTPCRPKSMSQVPKGQNFVCYRGSCVNQTTILFNQASTNINPCVPNPCKNNGVCVQNSVTAALTCKCPAGYADLLCSVKSPSG